MIRRPHVNAHSLRQRTLRRLRRLTGAVGVKSHQVHFVRTGEQLHKRVRFHDVGEAMAVEHALSAFGPSLVLPAFVVRYGKELWLEFVHGNLLDPHQAGTDLLPAFFAELYRRGNRLEPLANTTFPARLTEDIRFLERTGFLGAEVCRRLAARAVELAPEQVWTGFEYVDPLPKNFVLRDGRLVGVDVEALHPGALLGIGPAKAFLRWYDEPAAGFVARLREAGAPDISEQLAYAELYFRCAYAKQKTFQRKTRLAPVSMFDRYL